MSHGDDPGCCNPTADDDARIAEQCLKEGDFGHAGEHIAGLLGAEPHQARTQMLVEEWIRRNPNASAEPKSDYFGSHALWALALLHHGKPALGTDIMFQVAGAKPELDFPALLESHFSEPSFLEQVDADNLAAGIASLGARIGETGGEGSTAHQTLANLAAKGAGAFAESERLAAIASITNRKAGRIDAAKEIALRSLETHDTYLVRIALAGAHREAGDLPGAIAEFERSVHLTEDSGPLLDIGDLNLQLDRVSDAQRGYQRALERDPDSSWARASLLYCKGRLGDDTAQAELMRLAGQGDQRAMTLLDQRPGEAFIDYLPVPSDAMVSSFRQVYPMLVDQTPAPPKKQGFFGKLFGRKPKGGVSMSVSCIESPSAHLSLARFSEAKTGQPLAIDVAVIPSPDPRRPRKPVSHLLYRYDGITPGVIVDPPPPKVSAQVAELAAAPFALSSWWNAAGRSMKTHPASAVELLSAMPYPAAPPSKEEPSVDAFAPWNWMFRTQVAAGLMLAHLPDIAERNDALYSLLFGPIDWTTVASIIAQVSIAERDPSAKTPILRHLLELDGMRPDRGAWCLDDALGWALDRLSK